MVLGLPQVTQLLIAGDRLQDRDVHSSRLQRDSRARLDTEAEFPSTGTVLETVPCSEHPDDTLASWRQTRKGAEATVRGKEGKSEEIGTAEVIVG